MVLGLKDFYLETPMACYKYMRIAVEMVPNEIMDQFNLHSMVHNGFVYVEIWHGMYDLPQEGCIANEQLCNVLAPFVFLPFPATPGLWKHNTQPISFCLVVDNFWPNIRAKPMLILCLIAWLPNTSTVSTGHAYAMLAFTCSGITTNALATFLCLVALNKHCNGLRTKPTNTKTLHMIGIN